MDMVAWADPRVAGIEVRDCGERLVDVRTVAALRFDSRLADCTGAFALRETLVDRLVTAQTSLPAGLRLLTIEGYRSRALQSRYFASHMQRLRITDPRLSEAELRHRAGTYVAPPEVAPHLTGAAVDLTLCTVDGAELWMGTAVNATGKPGCHTDAPDIAAEARANRRLLSAALSTAGLVNHPSAWWHWSYGDRYWAYATGAGYAIYGTADS